MSMNYEQMLMERRERLRAKGARSLKPRWFLLVPVFVLAFWAIVTWLTMLGLGVLHSRIPAVPALGFDDSFFVWLGIALVSIPHQFARHQPVKVYGRS